MWLWVVSLALLAFASTDLLSKKKMATGNATTPLEMLISVGTLAFPIGLTLFFLKIGESGLAPWRILWSHPLIWMNIFCFAAYWFFYLCSMRYVGLSFAASVEGMQGILYFIGLVLIHFLCGHLVSVSEFLHPARLIPVVIGLTFIFLFPNVEIIANKINHHGWENLKKNRHRTMIGLLLLFLGTVADAGDSLTTTVIFDTGSIGLVDYLITSCFATIFPVVLFELYLQKKNGRWFIPFKDDRKNAICYVCTIIFSSLLYMVASSLDAVKTGIAFIAAPAFSIIGAHILLKEKYTWRQNLCIGIIVIASIVFGIADYILRTKV